ncbi:Assimilatory nitrite reductase, small subunit [gamma proteobacterium HdN1]|nr:Assimilatory nitrite reductase, small subunit [gamma proteobacterium HdN1]
MDTLFDSTRYLLNACQREFPLVSRPYAALAKNLSSDALPLPAQWNERHVLRLLQSAQRDGALSRVGPVFAPHGIGMSTLAALAVPVAQLDDVAEWINAMPEVNHNYARSHRYNLWFVVTGRDESDVQASLQAIRERWPELPLLDLPLVNAFYIDLGFGLDDANKPHDTLPRAEQRYFLSGAEWRLVALIQTGFPLHRRPWQTIARAWGGSEREVLDTLKRWLDMGIVKRYGTVLRHRELGYRANAMWVMDIPAQDIERVAGVLAQAPEVRLCYERPRRGAEWPYNLFCMVHGKCRESVEASVAELAARFDLQEYPNAILIGEHRYKQRGAWYAAPTKPDLLRKIV